MLLKELANGAKCMGSKASQTFAVVFTAGCLAFSLMACSDDNSSGVVDVSGSTDLPNAGPIATDTNATDSVVVKPSNPDTSETDSTTNRPVVNLTDEQTAILNGGLAVLLDTSYGAVPDSWDYGEDQPSEGTVTVDAYNKIVSPYGGWGSGRQEYRYKSEDGFRECYVQSNSSGSAVYSSREYKTNARYDNIFHYDYLSSVTSMRYTVLGSDTIVIKAVGTSKIEKGFWGLDYSCTEFLQNFKDDCAKENGLFKDFGDGCREERPLVSCAFFLPEGKSMQSYIDIYEQELIDFCMADSTMYSSKDDPDHAPGSCAGGSFIDENGNSSWREQCWYQNGEEMNLDEWRENRQIDSTKASAYDEWADSLTLTPRKYLEQFAVYEAVVDGILHLYDPDLGYKEGLAYNGFPEDPRAASYKEEGMYPLPDSLVEVFFPEMVKNPFWGDSVAVSSYQYKTGKHSFYMVVVKDVGEKGHGLTSVAADSVLVTDIVKVGSCPEDVNVHYSVFLLQASPNWDVSDKKIVRRSVEAPLWNCDDPESLKKVDPYREWIAPNGLK